MMLEVFSIALDVSNTVPHRVIPKDSPFLKQEHSWRQDWMPIAERDFGTDAVYCDYEPSKKGKRSQIFSRERDHSISHVKAIGVVELLDALTKCIAEQDGILPSILIFLIAKICQMLDLINWKRNPLCMRLRFRDNKKPVRLFSLSMTTIC